MLPADMNSAFDVAEDLYLWSNKNQRKIRKQKHLMYEGIEKYGGSIWKEKTVKKKTTYGLGFDLTDEISDEWSAYDKLVAKTHLENYGHIIIDEVYRTPIDNEHDLSVISGMIGATS